MTKVWTLQGDSGELILIITSNLFEMKNPLHVILLLVIYSNIGLSQHSSFDTIFQINKTPIWSYIFLRNTTKEFLEAAKGLEQNLINAQERWRNDQEKLLLLQQAVDLAGINQTIAQLGVQYASQSRVIALKNADLAITREINKDEQIKDGAETLNFTKKAHKEIIDRNNRANILGAILASIAAVGASIVTFGGAGVVLAGIAGVTGATVAATTAAATAQQVGAAISGLATIGSNVNNAIGQKSNEELQYAIQERQSQDQINQMIREKTELAKLSDITLYQIQQEEIAFQTSQINEFKTNEEFNHAQQRLDQYFSLQDVINRDDALIAIEIRRILDKYIEYSFILAKMTEKAYQCEEVVSNSFIRDEVYYINGNTSKWLAADKILLDLNTIEFSRITQKTQKPNFFSYTLSLNNKDPRQLQLLRDRGIMNFDITQYEMDLSYPGSYAQTIKNMDVTIIALADPNGIKGQITKSGLSWKKVPMGIAGNYSIDDWFNYVPSGYRGMIYSDEDETLLLPQARGIPQEPGLRGIFEGKPICGTYQLELPKYSNNFDYSTIIDVIVSFTVSAYFDPVLKSMVETELCEMQHANELTNGRVLSLSMAVMQPDEWYAFHNPDITDSLNYRVKYIPFYLKKSFFPSYQISPRMNDLSFTFLRNNKYDTVKFSMACSSLNPSRKLYDENGMFNENRIDTMKEFDWIQPEHFHPLVDQDSTVNVFYLDPINLDSLRNKIYIDSMSDEYELFIIRIRADDNPELRKNAKDFDLSKLNEFTDIVMDFGYQYNSDFCSFSQRTYAWMQVDRDTFQVRGIDAQKHGVPFLHTIGENKLIHQNELTYFDWKANIKERTFNITEILHPRDYLDIVPFYSFLHPKTPIEEIELKIDLYDKNNNPRNKETIIYCNPPWITMHLRRQGPTSLANAGVLQMWFEVDLHQRERFREDSVFVLKNDTINLHFKPLIKKLLNQPLATGYHEYLSSGGLRLSPVAIEHVRIPVPVITMRDGKVISDIYTFKNGSPADLIFRYVNLPDNSGRATVDIKILGKDQEGYMTVSRLFNKAPVFTRWRNENETNFALRLDRDDLTSPHIVLKDLIFTDYARY